jgi:hypothetical protein
VETAPFAIKAIAMRLAKAMMIAMAAWSNAMFFRRGTTVAVKIRSQSLRQTLRCPSEDRCIRSIAIAQRILPGIIALCLPIPMYCTKTFPCSNAPNWQVGIAVWERSYKPISIVNSERLTIREFINA